MAGRGDACLMEGGLDMGYSGKAIERMRADARQDNKQERRHRFALTSNDERTTVSRSLIYDKPRDCSDDDSSRRGAGASARIKEKRGRERRGCSRPLIPEGAGWGTLRPVPEAYSWGGKASG